MNVVQYFLGSSEVEPTAVCLVFMIKLQSAVHVNMFRHHGWGSEIILRGQNSIAESVYVGVNDFYAAVLFGLVLEEIQFFCQVLGQVIADETEIVILGSNLESPLQTLILDDFFPHTKAEMIGVHRQ